MSRLLFFKMCYCAVARLGVEKSSKKDKERST
jgi:hypothetical protein